LSAPAKISPGWPSGPAAGRGTSHSGNAVSSSTAAISNQFVRFMPAPRDRQTSGRPFSSSR
jgi:hypothetical protein